MSMVALRWVRPIRCSASQKAVLWALADQANDAGEAWPSMATLVEATCLSERTIQSALLGLRQAGLVVATIGGGRHRTTLYCLPLETPQEPRDTPQEPQGIHPQETPQELHETPQQVRDTPQQVRETPQEPHPNPQEPSRTLIEPPKRARAAPTIVVLPEWLPLDAWAEWCSHKGRKWGEGIGPTKALHLLRRYRDEGHDPREVIDHSIASGYAGLFPSKTTKPRAAAGKLDWVDNHPLFQRSA